MTDPSQLIPVVDGTLTLGADGFGPVMADALQRLTGGKPILVTGADRSVDGETVTVVGNATLLGGSVKATVSATALSDGASLNARFAAADGWHFSDSFASLPPFAGGSQGAGSNGASLLDRLTIATPAFFIATAQGEQDPVTGAELPVGVSFAGDFQPAGMLGILGKLIPPSTLQIPLVGPVLIPLKGETTPPLPSAPIPTMPWQTTWPSPGIDLFAEIGHATLGDKLGLDAVGIRFYSPTDADWMAANPTYSPIAAGSATLSIPSAGIAADVTLIGALSASRVSAIGAFSGVNFQKLADMTDAVGGQDLAGVLPSDVQAGLAKTLGKLSLIAAVLDIGPSLKVESVSIAVGIPDLDTQVLPGFTIDSLIASFSVADPFGSDRAITLTIGGRVELFGAVFDIDLAYPEVSARASLAAPAAIPLSKVAQYVGFDVPDVLPDLTLNALDFYVDKAGTVAFAVAAAQDPPWTIALGPTSLTVSDVMASIVRPAGGTASARFGGALTIAGVKLGVSYQSPGDFLLRSEFPEISLVGLAKDLTGSSLDFLPGGFDIVLLDNVAMIEKVGADLKFLLATDIEGLGWVGFEARRASGTWGFAFGLDLVDPRLSKLPGLGGLAPLESVFHMDELLLLVSSFDDPAFQFVPASAFDTPSLPPGPGVQIAKGGVIRGLNAYGRWTLDLSAQDQKLMRDLLGLKTVVSITLQVGAVPSSNSALFLSIDTTLCGMPLTGRFGGRILDEDVSLFIDGTLVTHIGGQAQAWMLSLQVFPTGILFMGGMKGTVTFDGIQLSNLGLVIGVDWEGIPSVSAAGAITAGDFHSSVAVFFNSADPKQSLLAGSISDLTLADVVDAFSDGNVPADIEAVLKEIALKGTQAFTIPAATADSLDKMDIPAISAAFVNAGVPLPTTTAQVLVNVGTPGEHWFVTNLANQMRHYTATKTDAGIVVTLDPQLYVAPQKVEIANTTYPQGFLVNGAVEVLTFEASATVSVDTTNGIAVDGTMSEVVIGTPELFSLTNSAGDAGPILSVSTYQQPNRAPPFKDPHVLIDGQLTMLGLTRRLYVSVGASRAVFDMSGNFIVGIDYDFHGSFAGVTDMSCTGSVKVGIGTIDLGPLGKINVGTYVHAAADIGVSPTDMWAKFEVGLDFMGKSFSGSVSLDVSVDTLKALPGKILDAVKAWLEQLFKDVDFWARAIASKLVEGVDDIGKVLTEFYGLSKEAAQKVLDTIAAFAGGCAATTARLAA
ncbi:MAG: hypothetical protein ACK4K7_10745 [Allosphingosinicella sp.]|uniref:hypothetical protein n=1 Tax=Allosphingosinicella sp. TaxID=2823234 RepID=UPI00392C1996